MKRFPSFQQIVFALALTAILIGFYGISQQKEGTKDSFRKEKSSKEGDTSTSSSRAGGRSVNYFDGIEDQMQQLSLQMKNLEKQLKNIDISRYNDELEKVKNIDVENVAKELQKKMKEVNLQKINMEISNKEIKINNLKLQEVHKQIEQAKAELRNQKLDIKIDGQKMQADIERSMKKVQKSLENVKDEIKNVKEFTDQLEKDGLIDKSKAYKIEVKDGYLYINGKQQSKETSDKYKRFYKKSDFTINMSEGDEFRI